MKSTAAKKEEFTFPSGGIADFYMEDHEIEALEKEEAEQEFGSAGIATFNPIARRMASYGRYGDDTVAHVETGELVVPKALIDNNPNLKDSIFSHLRELGVEDPEQYIVGSGVNSINPDTGMPEFFLKKIFSGIKKAVSGVARGVKKAFKSVVKVVKKAAPVIIPFALNALFPGLGAIYAGALGSGIGTLIQGGSLKDAFKNALIGGAIGGATAGVQGALAARSAGTSISAGAVQGIKDAAKFSNLTTAGKQLATGQFGKSGLEAVQGVPNTTTISDAGGADQFQGQVADASGTIGEAAPPDDFVRNESFRDALTGGRGTAGSPDSLSAIDQRISNIGGRASDLLGSGTGDVATGTTFDIIPETPSLMSSIKDAFTPGGRTFTESLGDIFMPSGATAQEILAANNIPQTAENLKAAADLAAKSAPGIIRTFGPAAAVAGLGAAAGGFFSKPEQPELNIDDIQGVTGSDLLRDNPDKYLLAGRGSGTPGQVVVPTDYQFMGQMPDFRSIYPQTFAADGGEIFPRRTGGIMPNEGTPGKDSVRAMLMPGEFVMTTDAVKGMGDGNNEKGINRMYDMMRNLESRGKAMA